MNYLKKLSISIGISFISILSLTLLLTILNYSSFISNSIMSIFEILIPIISILIGSIYLGKRTEKKGYIEGLKLGIIFILILFILNIIISDFKTKYILFYIILITSSILGSMIGINKKSQ